jgi:hypothetical protein
VRYDVDPVARAKRNAEYAARFRKERDALRNAVLSEEQQVAAKQTVAEYHEKMKLLFPVPTVNFTDVYRKRNAIVLQRRNELGEQQEVAIPITSDSAERLWQIMELWQRIVQRDIDLQI